MSKLFVSMSDDFMLPTFDHKMAADACVTQQAVNSEEKTMNEKLFVKV